MTDIPRRRKTDLQGPEPDNDREYLIQIYAAARAIDLKLDAVCERQDGQESRITAVERWQHRASASIVTSAKIASILGVVTGLAIGLLKLVLAN